MRSSKFVRIDDNVLIEYIYDDGNLIGESYSIITNSNTKVNQFISTLDETNNNFEIRKVLIGGVTTERFFSNQLIPINKPNNQYSNLSPDKFSFIQKMDFGSSIPIRYDKIRVWLSNGWTFDEFKGFYMRVYSLDYNDSNYVDLSNYYFNISDPDQIGDISYSSPGLFQFEKMWGRYIELQFPSVSKVSKQRRDGLTRQNTINYNLTNGVGLSENSPVFVDFFFINSVRNINNSKFYNLVNELNLTFTRNPEYEKFGVVVKPSDFGDFFVIYSILNGSVGEFNKFIEDSILRGNRYYVEYIIDVYEKNIKTSTQKVVITQDFIQEVEFRPIFKLTTTTAIIDVTCNLIDSVNNSKVSRRATYGLLQDEVSKYSKYLTKININKFDRVNVFKIKSSISPSFGFAKSQQLKVNTNTFTLYSNEFWVNVSKSSVEFEDRTWIGKQGLSITLNPYDNVFKFNIISKDEFSDWSPLDLNVYSDINLNFRSDSKLISVDIYRDSDENDLEFGKVVFKLTSDKYDLIRDIFSKGFNQFYITGVDSGNKDIIFSGTFTPWDVESNISRLNQEYNQTLNLNTFTDVVSKDSFSEDDLIDKVRNKIDLGEDIQTSTNTSVSISKVSNNKNFINLNQSINNQLVSIENSIFLDFNPPWKGDFKIQSYSFNNRNYWSQSFNFRDLSIKWKQLGIIDRIDVVKETGNLSDKTFEVLYSVLGYYKLHNFDPNNDSINFFIKDNLDDLKSFISSNLSPKSKLELNNIVTGSNVPSLDVYKKIQDYLGIKLEIETKTKYKKT